MPGEAIPELELEIAHILFIDTVGFSKLLMDEQRKLLADLNGLVRGTETFRQGETKGSLVRLPTGDGMALVFAHDPEAPVRCAMEIDRAARARPGLPLRMGIHSGPVSRVVDVNDHVNITGSGINTAQRVMNCGDARHILLSKRAADDLAQYSQWHPFFHDLGECEVKHGVKIPIINFFNGEIGNPELPVCRKNEMEASRSREASVRASRRRKRLETGGVIVGLAAILIAGFVAYEFGTRRLPGIPEKSIAVLPFANLTNDAENGYLADGIMDEILTDLSRVSSLKVISRTSSMQFRSDVPRNLREIANSLGVAHILEGTIQRVEGRLRVSAQLIDARSDAHIWAQHFDMEVSNIFDIESQVAETIVSQLKSKISPEEKAAIEARSTEDWEAHQLFVRSKDVLAASVYTRGRENREQAIRLLEQAVGRDPSYFLAFCQLARVHSELYLLGMDHTPRRLALADEALHKAAALKPDGGETHLAAGIRAYCSLDYHKARSELDLALQRLPNQPLIFEFRGFLNRRQSRWAEASEDLKSALDLDPLNFYFLQQVSQSDEKLRRFDDMAEMMRRALALAPHDPGARMHLACAPFYSRADTKPLRETLDSIITEDPQMASSVAVDCVHLGLCERDFVAANRAVGLIGEDGGTEESFSFPRSWYAGLVARSGGDTEAARKAFTQARLEMANILKDQPDYPEALSVIGLIDAGLGDAEHARAEASRAVELLPVGRDAINGALAIQYLAIALAWVGEKDESLQDLALVAKIPSDVNYGQLKLHPFWDPLRGDPRFEAIVASLQPKKP
jgi:TolB-like protein/Tfp pilus assembly protein PilF